MKENSYSQVSSVTNKTKLDITINLDCNISNAKKTFIIGETEKLLYDVNFIDKFWKDLIKIHLNSEWILTFNLFKILYNRYKAYFNEIFGIIETKDFFDELDEDNDGFLNEDEQILIFSLIKAKFCKTSQELLSIKEYKLFKQLNINIKHIEKQINIYQNILRQNIHKNQLNKYNLIGRNKMNIFVNKCNSDIINFNNFKNEKKFDFFQKKKEDINFVETQYNTKTELLKIKPKKEVREYQIQERLIALEERIEEANNYKKQIKILRKNEEKRLNQIYNLNLENRKRKMNNINNKLENYLNIKLANEENKLKIHIAKESDVLSKKIALHKNDILRIQKMSYKEAIHKGDNLGDLINLKSRLKKQNKLLQNFKSITQSNFKNNNNDENNKINTRKSYISRKSFKTPNIKTNLSLTQLKKLKNSKFIIRFYIRQKFGEEIPCNIKNDNNNKKENLKLEKYLKNNNEDKNIIPKISKYYDDNLNEIKYEIDN